MAGKLGRLVYSVCNCQITGNMRRCEYWPLFPFPPTVGDLTQVKQIANVFWFFIHKADTCCFPSSRLCLTNR